MGRFPCGRVAPLPVTLLMVLLAFAPPLAYAAWMRNLERREREPWLALGLVFLWGATGAIVLAIALTKGFVEMARPHYAAWGIAVPLATFSLFVFTPLAEEPAKAVALLFVRDARAEPEDGLVYGAVAGLGFAAVETFLYAQAAYAASGLGTMLVVGALRGFASAFLHAAASGLVGYAFLRTGSPWRRLGFLGVAVAIHAAYNLLLSAHGVLSAFVASTVLHGALGLLGALALAVAAFALVRRHVAKLDGEAPDDAASA